MSFNWGQRTYIMGILNITPDSFSGDGLLSQADVLTAAVKQAQDFAAAGADILDIGGQSTRPGSAPVSAEAELARVLPVLQAVRQAVDLPISIDTYWAKVAKAALQAGANWVNDVWGLRMDSAMPALIAAAGCPVVLMHNRFAPRSAAEAAQLGHTPPPYEYTNLLSDVCRELEVSINLALNSSIQPDQIIVDPGIGFGKTLEQNLQLINHLDQIKALGYPVLLGTSRKGFIGRILDLPPQERVEGTLATVVIGIDRGADIVRVHDVAATVRAARLTDQLVRPQPGTY
ncbi:MAG: dihydropteroate synthase [Ardenticatenaceae bacterium]|nr:dihydropteroate synthase [Ardenticatenaceae bacterium]